MLYYIMNNCKRNIIANGVVFMKKMLIIDGNSILNRAYYGIRPLTNKDGLYTHAVYGMVSMIQKQMIIIMLINLLLVVREQKIILDV